MKELKAVSGFLLLLLGECIFLYYQFSHPIGFSVRPGLPVIVAVLGIGIAALGCLATCIVAIRGKNTSRPTIYGTLIMAIAIVLVALQYFLENAYPSEYAGGLYFVIPLMMFPLTLGSILATIGLLRRLN